MGIMLTLILQRNCFPLWSVNITMAYIEYKPVTVTQLVCSHPHVDRIWEYGGLSMNATSSMQRVICIILKDKSRHEFKDEGKGGAIIEAEKFLSEIN